MKTSAEDPCHAGARHWQDRFDSRVLSDRLGEKWSRSELTDDDCAFSARQRPTTALCWRACPAQPVVRVAVDLAFPNGPRCIHRMRRLEVSP